jgi:5-hydroxyisourate hydrolase
LLRQTKPGAYRLLFHAGAYLKTAEFYDIIPVHFLVTNEAHYHVPLILSPFGYSTYRGT